MDTSQVTVYSGGQMLTVQNGGIVVDAQRGIVTLTDVDVLTAGDVVHIVAPVKFAAPKWKRPRDRSAPYFRRGRWE